MERLHVRTTTVWTVWIKQSFLISKIRGPNLDGLMSEISDLLPKIPTYLPTTSKNSVVSMESMMLCSSVQISKRTDCFADVLCSRLRYSTILQCWVVYDPSHILIIIVTESDKLFLPNTNPQIFQLGRQSTPENVHSGRVESPRNHNMNYIQQGPRV